VKEQKRQ